MSESKKVILVANSTWNIYNFRLNLVNKLIDEGHQVIVIAPIDEYLEYKERFPQVKHVPLKMMKRDSTNPFRDFLLIVELYRKYKWLRPDLVIHYTNKPNIYGAYPAKLMKSKSVGVVTGLGYTFIHEGFLNLIVRKLYKWSGKYHDRFIFENQEDRKLFVDSAITKSENAFAVKGCGVDTSHYLPHPNGYAKNALTFTFVGRLLYDKGIIEFIEAAKIIKEKDANVKFVVIGEFDKNNPSAIDRDYMIEWVDKGIIDYRGFVRDIRPILQLSDCVVLPSYREGLARTLTEGMSMGKPLITTNVPGCSETVEEGVNGYLVPAKNSVALSEAMQKLIELPYEERKAMGDRGREMAENTFDHNLIADHIYEIVKPLLNASS